MEFGTREILIIFGIVVIFGILLHGFRSVRHTRNGSIKVGRRRQGIFDDDGFDELPGELLTGEVRVTKRDKTRVEEVSDTIKRAWERNSERKTSAFRERYERSGNVVPFQPAGDAKPGKTDDAPAPDVARRDISARRGSRHEERPVYQDDLVEEPVIASPDEIRVSLDEFEICDEVEPTPSRYGNAKRPTDASDDRTARHGGKAQDNRYIDDNYIDDDYIDDGYVDDGYIDDEPVEDFPADNGYDRPAREPEIRRDQPLVATRDDDLKPSGRSDKTFKLEPVDAATPSQRRKPFWEEPQPVQAPAPVEPEPEPPRTQSNRQTEVIVLHLMAKSGAPIAGKDLLDALLANGLRFGSMQIFHRHLNPDGSGPVLFSLANSVKPGIFNLATMDSFETPGVSLFMALEGLDHPLEAYKELVKIAQNMAKALNVGVLDETRSVLTKQTIEHYRQQIIDFTRRSFTLTH